MVQYGGPSRSSWAKSVRWSFSRTMMGKAIWENPAATWLGEGSWLWMLIRTPRRRVILSVYVDDIKLTGKHWSDVESTQQRSWLGRPTSFLDHVYLRCTQRQCEISKDTVDNYRTMFESRISAERSEKLHYSENFRIIHGLMIWKVKLRNAWSDIVSWQTRRLNNSTKYLLHSSLTTTSKKKKWNLLDSFHKYALKLFWNVYTWHELEDLRFYGQWTSLRDPSQNGVKHVTNAWNDWFLTFIIHVNTNSIVMWVILKNNAGWDCFKTPILQEILRTQNPTLEEHYVFLVVIHLFQ